MKTLVTLVAALLCGHSLFAAHSQLWGAHGEKWSPTGRLPDFSFAGYQRGEKPLPQIAKAASVRDFGAVGDGIADDTKAFQDALGHVQRGAVEVPPGRYKITDMLVISRSGVVLRGAGPDKTILVFPRPLQEVKPNMGATTTGQPTSNYSWSGGFISIRGSFQSRKLADIAAAAERGSQVVIVATNAAVAVGQEIELFQSDTPENTLAIHLYTGDAGKVTNLKGRTRVSFVAKVVKVDGNRLHIDRPLRCDFRPEWKPQVRTFQPSVTNSGIEDLAFEFPEQPYKGHFTELGFNAIAFGGVAHCWARNIRTINADSGMFISGHFNTLLGIVLESRRSADNQNCIGHHGITMGGSDNLLTAFEIRARYIHDITVSGSSVGNVISRGRAVDLALDHHKYAPFENLFSCLDAGAGTRLWKCGGGADLGKHSAARETFWNIRSAKPLSYPPAAFGPPSMNLVALQTSQSSETIPNGKWFEVIPHSEIQPPDLHEAAKARRLKAVRN